MRRLLWAVAVIAAWLSPPAARAFKDHDFQTECAKVAFCNRLRGVQQPSYAVQPGSVRFAKDSLSATLRNPEAGKDFSLQLSAYDGALRVRVFEPGNQRYEVQDVLMPKLPAVPLQRGDKSESQTALKLGDQTVLLRYSPFQIEVPGVLVLNDRSLFAMEHKRQKQDGDPDGWWEETFKSHTDSKPRGPQAISFDLTFPDAAHVYGIPEHAAPLSLPPTAGTHPDTGAAVQSEPYRLYNLDVFEYLADSPFGIYGAIPFLTAHSARRTTGAFWLNAAEMYVDVARHGGGTQTQWIAESGALDLFLLLGPTPATVQGQFATLTGTTALPPMFSLGYHQCRWNYNDEADVKQVNAGFDAHAMPCDVIWLDIEHTVGKQYMTWDKHKFPHPKEMIDGVASFGRKMVCIVDPHVKRDESYPLYKEAEKKGYYIRNKDGKPFDGWCWPGSSSYLDVMSPAIRAWWGKQLALDKYPGSTEDLHIWNDMNEPSVFNGPEITMPKDALHFGPGGDVEHRDVHNAYGLMYHLATAEGLRLRGPVAGRPSQRPFVLSRAFFAGTQRVGPIWTGDNMATWEHLKLALPMLLSISVAGLPNCGADVGGFFGDPAPDLLVRWYQSAAMYPFFRGHAHLDSARREPWLFGEPYTSQIRDALRERYALLPYLYTLFRAANMTNAPIMRPLWYDFPDQERLFATQTAFMLGPAMLSAPVLEQGAEAVVVPFPAGERWFDAATGAEVPAEHGGSVQIPVSAESMPRYYRGGHILARRNRARRSTKAQEHDPYTIIVALDQAQRASGQLYIDDGTSYDFLGGKYLDINISFEDGVLSWTLQHAGATFDSVVESVVIIGHEGARSGEGSFAFSIDDIERQGEAARGSDTVGMFGADVVVLRGPHKPVSTAWTLRLHPR